MTQACPESYFTCTLPEKRWLSASRRGIRSDKLILCFRYKTNWPRPVISNLVDKIFNYLEQYIYDVLKFSICSVEIRCLQHTTFWIVSLRQPQKYQSMAVTLIATSEWKYSFLLILKHSSNLLASMRQMKPPFLRSCSWICTWIWVDERERETQ